VFVFTPQGKVINLPQDANVVDFAYAIHSDIGNRMTGARVNNRMVGFDYHLQNGDIIEIITGAGSGPSRDWLKMVKTSEAKSKIKQWFKKERREENILHGKASFEQELRRNGISQSVVTQEEVQAPALKRMGLGSMDDLYAAIGFGGVTATRAINRFRDELVRIAQQADLLRDESLARLKKRELRPQKSISGIVVEGLDNCLIKFSKCCTPVPGDRIVGFITRGFGLSIHKENCKNVLSLKENEGEGRWMEVSWADEIREKYRADITILARDRKGLLMDIVSTLTAISCMIYGVNTDSKPDGTALIQFTIEVSDADHLETVRKKLMGVEGILSVARR